jgi:hypothetical protein
MASGRHHRPPPFPLFSLFSLVLAENYQRVLSRSPQKPWVFDGSAAERTAKPLAVISLLFAVLCCFHVS